MQLVHVTLRINRKIEQPFDSIVAKLEASGLVDVEAHQAFYIINGMILESELERLKQIPGVVSVRKDQFYRKI